MSSSSSSDSDNDDIDLAINQIVMNNVRATELIKELRGWRNVEIPRGPRKDRGREEGHNKLVADYFAEHPVYNDVDFDRRFRMSRRLFLRIVNDLDREVDFFKQQWDARGVKGFSPLQKCASAIRQLAYGSASDAFDEYLRMSETTSRDCLEHFCKGIIFLYMRQYLRKPTATDVQAIYALHEQTHGLPGMLGSIDCMHWYWKNCPMAWRGQFHRGDHTGPSVILEAVASQDQWIWHAFFGVPGATNDIIVVNQSPIFNDLFENKAPDSSFVVNNTHYNHGYYLADGIYPEWTTFVKAFRYPVEEPRVHFKTRQESARKDIERTFATLKDKWHVVKYPARVWTQRKLSLIMHTCIILHNMIREDEGFSHYPFDPTEVLPGEIETTISEKDRARNVNLVKNRERHANLRHDLSIHGMRGMIVDERYGVGRVVGKLMWQLMWQQFFSSERGFCFGCSVTSSKTEMISTDSSSISRRHINQRKSTKHWRPMLKAIAEDGVHSRSSQSTAVAKSEKKSLSASKPAGRTRSNSYENDYRKSNHPMALPVHVNYLSTHQPYSSSALGTVAS
ncbi:hypothetical protein OSB04_008017 [Centaurea solstitialis]|uniref:Uncharacterized protein n=1 Tax=Centaurea solstitialis TaxID=347529 RepID=A0AA38U484_9ASTR|nr:hypothetical protein OSB04_008017 [Centaurea solstitialis]